MDWGAPEFAAVIHADHRQQIMFRTVIDYRDIGAGAAIEDMKRKRRV